MQFIVRANPAESPPTGAIALLGDALIYPPNWTYEIRPTMIVLTVADSQFQENTHGREQENDVKEAKAKEIVRASCDGREDIRPSYFRVERSAL